MEWRGTPYSPKLQGWNLAIRLFNVKSKSLVGVGSYPSAETQSVYFTAPADLVVSSSCFTGEFSGSVRVGWNLVVSLGLLSAAFQQLVFVTVVSLFCQ